MDNDYEPHVALVFGVSLVSGYHLRVSFELACFLPLLLLIVQLVEDTILHFAYLQYLSIYLSVYLALSRQVVELNEQKVAYFGLGLYTGR